MQLETSVSTPHLILTAVGLWVGYLVLTSMIVPLFSEQAKYLSSTPWAGLQGGWFARLRGGLRFVTDARSMMKEGYEKYNRNSKPFIIPQFFRPALTVLPAEQFAELLSLPDEKIDEQTINGEGIANKWTIGRELAGGGGPHIDIVRRQLTRRLPLLTSYVYDELVLAMKDEWPTKEGEWTTVKTLPTCMRIVSRAANRVFSGTELCRNVDFLDNSREYSVAVFKSGALINMWPTWMHPVVAPIITRKMKYHFNICKDLALPVIRQRLSVIRNPPKGYTAPIDCLQWLLEDCIELAKTNPAELDELLLVRRLLLLNMVAIHTTSMVTTNTLLDLYSSPRKDEFVAGLREEVERVLRESGGEWTKTAINSMHRIDSMLRETMRVTTMGETSLPRLVRDPKGVHLAGGSVFLPYGTRVAVDGTDVMTDPRYYGQNAKEWDGFRFSRTREEYLASVEKDGADPERLKSVLEQKNQAVIATGEDFLAFGHGRHACPGRFFASQEMKLMLAHIVMNYDMNVEGGRPESWSMNGATMPHPDAQIQIKPLASKTKANGNAV